MKEKYLVSVNEKGHLCWVGINIDDKIIVKRLIKTDDKEVRLKQIKDIDEEYHDFIESINNKTIKIVPSSFFLNQVEEQIKEQLVKEGLSNPKVYNNQINKCIEDIISGKQITLKHASYKVGDSLYATSDVGKIRKNQEDSVLIMEHPENNDFKIIAVSDGVGGNAKGELASNHVVKKMSQWFEKIDKNYYYNTELLINELKAFIPTIMVDLDVPQSSATTLTAAIIGKDETLIINIGDSRIYTFKNDEITRETKDHSLVDGFSSRIPEEILRFNKMGNVITNSIKKSRTTTPAFKIIENNSYDRIIAVSDGVSDCLSKEQLKNIMKNANKETLTEEIVENAINNDSILQEEVEKLPERKKVIAIKELKENKFDYYKDIAGGKDNTTVAAYIKK